MPALLLLIACTGKEEIPVGTLSVTDYLPPWAEHLEYRDVAPADLDAGVDTAGALGDLLHIGTSGADTSWSLDVRRGAAWETAEAVLSLDLSSADGGLTLTAVDGVALDPVVVLVGQSFKEGETVQSGDWTTSAARVDAVTTWYGTVEDALEITVSGPTTGLFRLGAGLGPAQWSWDSLAGDLAWYE